MKSANAGSVSIWLNLELVATALLGRFFFKESLDKNSVIGILFMIGSGIIVTFNEGVAGIIPAVLVFLACVCWGLDNHSTGMIEQISPSQVTFLKGISRSLNDWRISSSEFIKSSGMDGIASTSPTGTGAIAVACPRQPSPHTTTRP